MWLFLLIVEGRRVRSLFGLASAFVPLQHRLEVALQR
jgi:hypothetical protein